MIIVKTADKDTFVTDLSTQFNKGVISNFGQASTLDLFKITGENKNTKSRSMMTVNAVTNGHTFKLKDHTGNLAVSFIIKTDVSTVDGSLEGDNVIVGTLNAAGDNLLERFISAINNVSSFANSLTLDITAYKLDNNKILLQQNKSGTSGDTVPEVPSNENSLTITPFRRFEHSAVLLNFDLQDIYTSHISNLSNSIFTNVAGTAADFKAVLKLSDVGISSTSPVNLKLRIRILKNDFNEGFGRDTVHFSDLGNANFKSISDIKNWSVEGMVTIDDVYIATEFEQTIEVKGNDDVEFDITDYLYDFLVSASNDPNKKSQLYKSFIIDFHHDTLFDEYTYFVKRLGSRNISNMYLRPKLEVKLKDRSISSVNYDKKKVYLDNEENFYITNLLNKKLSSFPGQTKLKLEYLDSSNVSGTIRLLRTPIDNSYINITDSAGLIKNYGFLSGGAEFTVGEITIPEERVINTAGQTVNSVIILLQNLINSNSGHNGSLVVSTSADTLTIKHVNAILQQESFIEKQGDSNNSLIIKEIKEDFNILPNEIVESNVYDYKGNTVVGVKKFNLSNTLISRFNTSKKFQLDLINNRKVKINFKYYITNNGKDFLLKSEDIDFLLPETEESDLFKKIRVVLDTQQKDITADNSIKALQFSFIDLSRQYKSVNTPVSLVSEDLGDVSYSIYNVDTGKTLIENSSDYDDTLLIFNGKQYIANFYAAEIYKGLRVSFVFKYTDHLTGLSKNIKDSKLIVRFT